MKQPHANVILSTVGTSLLTRRAPSRAVSSLVNTHTNVARAEDVPAPERATLRELLAQITGELADMGAAQAKDASAELNGILTYYAGRPIPSADQHILLCSDTWLGEATGRLVEAWLRRHGAQLIDVVRHKDLQTLDLDAFQAALSDLVRYCERRFAGCREAGFRVVFNLTGGFKSVQGFMQTLAPFYADETVYIFETGGRLLRIPRLPIQLAPQPAIRQHLATFRRLSQGLAVPPDHLHDVPETFLLRLGADVCLSPWGEIVWAQARRELYRDALFDPPTARLVFGDGFRRSVQRQPGRVDQVNAQVDELARYLETRGAYNPKSLSFKSLTGNPHPPATHEAYAWSDAGAWRLFGYYANDVFVLDELDKHL